MNKVIEAVGDAIERRADEMQGAILTVINPDGTHSTRVWAQDRDLFEKLSRATSPSLKDYTLADLYKEFPLRTET